MLDVLNNVTLWYTQHTTDIVSWERPHNSYWSILLSSKHFDLYHWLIIFPFLLCLPDGWSLFILAFFFSPFVSLIISYSIHCLIITPILFLFLVLFLHPSMFSISLFLSPLSVRLMTFFSVTCGRSGPWSGPCSCWRAQNQNRRKERWRVTGRKRLRSRSLSLSPRRLRPLPGKYGIWLARVCCTFSVWWCCLWPTAGVNLNNIHAQKTNGQHNTTCILWKHIFNLAIYEHLFSVFGWVKHIQMVKKV